MNKHISVNFFHTEYYNLRTPVASLISLPFQDSMNVALVSLIFYEYIEYPAVGPLIQVAAPDETKADLGIRPAITFVFSK